VWDEPPPSATGSSLTLATNPVQAAAPIVPVPLADGVAGSCLGGYQPCGASGFAAPVDPLYAHYSIDVECVASGRQCRDRIVAQISLVRGDGAVLLNLYVTPSVPVFSYMTPLTGLTRELLDERGVPLEEALAQLRIQLPRDAVLVGQGIANDVQWLGLVEGEDFGCMLDLAALWRVWNHNFQSWSIFSQEHLAKVLLGEDINGGAHNAVDDAVKAIKLWRLHGHLTQMGGNHAVEEAKARLLMVPVSPPFKKRHPVFEGVCMGDKRTCQCGAQFSFS
jgi:RNA exonuclease 4